MKQNDIIINRVLNNRLGIEYLEKIAEKYDIINIINVEDGKVIEISIREK